MVVYLTSCKMGLNPCPLPQATLPLLKLLCVLTLNWDNHSHYFFQEWLFLDALEVLLWTTVFQIQNGTQ